MRIKKNTGFKDETGVFIFMSLLERTSDFRRDGRHIFFGLCIFGPELELASVVARDDMEMQVEHKLSRRHLVIRVDMHTMRTHGVPHCGRDAAHSAHHARERVVVDIENVTRWFFGNYERVSRGIWVNVEKGDGCIVFIHNFRGNLPSNDFCEHGVFHECSVS